LNENKSGGEGPVVVGEEKEVGCSGKDSFGGCCGKFFTIGKSWHR